MLSQAVPSCHRLAEALKGSPMLSQAVPGCHRLSQAVGLLSIEFSPMHTPHPTPGRSHWRKKLAGIQYFRPGLDRLSGKDDQGPWGHWSLLGRSGVPAPLCGELPQKRSPALPYPALAWGPAPVQ